MALLRHAEKRRTSTCRFADRVASESLACYRRVVQDRPPATCLATIVAFDRDVDTLTVLGLGVGTKFLPERILRSEECLDRVRDCHAEVLARRAFRRFLTLELLRRKETGLEGPYLHGRRLKDSVSLHFYCSSAPCGDAVVKKFAKMKKEVFREDLTPLEWPTDAHERLLPSAISLGQGALLIKKDQSCESPVSCFPSYLSRKQSRWPKYSNTDWCPPGTTTTWSGMGSIHTCSDKLCRWNILGLQGSLLSTQLDPLFMETLTVGRKLSNVTCRRAVCCRADTPAEPLKSMNHPSIMGTSVYMDDDGTIDMSEDREAGQDVRFHSPHCYAWWPDLYEAVTIDGSTGYEVSAENEETTSEISTVSLTTLYLQLVEQDPARTPRTVGELAAFKRTTSTEYEDRKTRLGYHSLLRDWKCRSATAGLETTT